MRVAVLNRPGEVAVVERPAPVPGPDEVLVRVRAVGVCGSDTHYFDHGRIGRFVVESPLVLGHEASGVVEGVGSDVDPTRIGERVSIEPGVPCRQCAQCLAGRYNLCPDMVFHATPPVDGSLAELVVIHHAFAHPVPDSVGDEEAALLEPLSVGIWACRKGRIGPGSRVLVTGAGPIGLLAALLGTQRGLEVHVLDRVTKGPKPELVHAIGATYHHSDIDAVTERVRPDVVLEATGVPQLVLGAMSGTAAYGITVLTGVSSGGRTLPVDPGGLNRRIVLENDAVVGSVNANLRHYGLAADALAAADLGWLGRLVSRRVPLARYAEAFEPQDDDVKVVLDLDAAG
jgi:L-iditol 2-dehydrogenase